MKKYFIVFALLMSVCLYAEEPSLMNNRLEIQNTILTTINGKTISVMDVMKKMNATLYHTNPDLYDSLPARYQFYITNWKYAYDEMINNELILQESVTKGLKLTNGEIREEMEKRYGPNIVLTLENLKMTFDEGFELMKKEMTVQRMNWYFVHSKALQAATPEKIRLAYNEYCQKNAPHDAWHYQIVSLKSSNTQNLEKASEKLVSIIKDKKEAPKALENAIKGLQKDFANITVSITDELEMADNEISQNHKAILEKIAPGQYSSLQKEVSKTNEPLHRIYYLKDHTKATLPSFDSLAGDLKNDIIQKEAMRFSKEYISKLRKDYGIEDKMNLPDNFQPFVLR
jgi:hypothetical protein